MADQVTIVGAQQRFKKTPAGEIPVDWECKPLSEIAELINGHGFGPNDWKQTGLPIIRIQNLNGGAKFDYYQGTPDARWIVNDGDLLFAWSGNLGTSFGPYIWKGPRGVLNQHIYLVRNRSGVDAGFLYQLLLSVTTAVEQRAHGSAGLVHVTKRELESFVVPIPPAQEQTKIAKILFAVGEDVVAARKEFEQSRLLRQHVVNRLFLQNSTKWRKRPLCELLLEPIRNGYSPLCPYEATGRWTLELGALSVEGFRPGRIKPAPIDDPKCADSILKPSDLLVSRSNTRNLVGLASIYEGTPDNCIYPDLMMRVRLDSEKMLPDFLQHYLVSPSGRRYFQTHARGTSGSMVKINASILGSMPIPSPVLDEQRRMVQGLREIRSLIEAGERAWKAIADLERGLRHQLLTGRKRVIE